MRARSGTSQDAKRAREALMKELAALPVSDKAKSRARDAQHKADADKPGKPNAALAQANGAAGVVGAKG